MIGTVNFISIKPHIIFYMYKKDIHNRNLRDWWKEKDRYEKREIISLKRFPKPIVEKRSVRNPCYGAHESDSVYEAYVYYRPGTKERIEAERRMAECKDEYIDKEIYHHNPKLDILDNELNYEDERELNRIVDGISWKKNIFSAPMKSILILGASILSGVWASIISLSFIGFLESLFLKNAGANNPGNKEIMNKLVGKEHPSVLSIIVTSIWILTFLGINFDSFKDTLKDKIKNEKDSIYKAIKYEYLTSIMRSHK